MSWPPRHRILTGDVLPVELVNDAHDAANKARSKIEVDHHVRGNGRGWHNGFFTPIASAFVRFPASGADRDDGLVFVSRSWGRWIDLPSWSARRLWLSMRVRAAAVVGVRVAAAASGSPCAFGLPYGVELGGIDDPGIINVGLPDDTFLVGLRTLYVEVYGVP